MVVTNALTAAELAEMLEKAWRAGRSIVPVIGAGTSADAGVPPLSLVTRYIGAVNAFSARSLYLPPGREKLSQPDQMYDAVANAYQSSEVQFLLDHGWPDRFSLQHAMAQSLRDTDGNLEQLIDSSLNNIARAMYPKESERIESLRSAISAKLRGDADALTKSEPKDLLLDWRPLIRHITDFRAELADALFFRLHAGRLPAMSHRYLAFLTKLLGIRAVFTFNFDPLIENAFAAEGYPHQVFAMEAGRTLPPLALISPPAIIKMHGSTHNLLVDERVDYPLADEYKRRFLELAGDNPLLLVVGCSGSDRRLRDLVQCVTANRKGHASISSPDVAWAQFVQDASPIPTFASRSPPALVTCCFRDAGLLFAHLYFSLTSRFPASRAQYEAHASKFYPLASINQNARLYSDASPIRQFWQSSVRARMPWPPRVLIIDGMLLDPSSADVDRCEVKLSHSTLPAFLSYICAIPAGFALVYIDLEDHHSLGSVIADILGQAGQADTAILPLLLPVGSDPGPLGDSGITISAAVRRIHLALSRQKVALVFDGLETFDWRTTTHHGVTTASKEFPDPAFAELLEFVTQLVELHAVRQSLSDSIICVTIDEPSVRHEKSERERAMLPMRRSLICESLSRISGPSGPIPRIRAEVLDTSSDDEGKPGLLSRKIISITEIPPTLAPQETSLFLQMIVSIRRTRSLNLLRAAYDQVVGGGTSVAKAADREIARLIADHVLIPLEGGYFAMDRVFRNLLYDAYTRYTSSEHVAAASLFRTATLPDHAVPIVRHVPIQLYVSANVHDACARWYYNNSYLASRDSWCFFEYVYHRVSSLRALTDLLVICSISSDSTQFLQELDSFSRSDSRVARNALRRLVRFDPVSAGAENLVLSSLWRTHHKWLCGLTKSWERTEPQLRNSTAAERLLTWCRTLLNYDLYRNVSPQARLEHLTNRVLPDSEWLPKEPDNRDTITANDASRQAMIQVGQGVEELRVLLRRSQARCYYERGDFCKLISHRCESIRSFLTQVAESHQIVHDDLHRALRDELQYNQTRAFVPDTPTILLHLAKLVVVAEQLEDIRDENTIGVWQDVQHWALDIVIAMHWRVYCEADTFDTDWDKIFKALSRIAEVRPNGGQRWDHEAQARLKYIEIEHFLGSRFPIAKTIVNAGALRRIEDASITEIDNALEIARNAIDSFLDDTDSARGRMRNPLLNATADNTLLIPYRALFRILQARLYVERVRIAHTADEDAFRKGYAECELARGSIGRENQALLTICELTSAQLALQHAIKWVDFKSWEGDRETVMRQLSKLRSASAYLDLAERSLRIGGRHVLLWRTYTLSRATTIVFLVRNAVAAMVAKESEAERFISGGTMNEHESLATRKTLVDGGRIVRMVREGLQAIRDGLDHTPERATRYLAGFFEVWHELLHATFMGYALTRSALLMDRDSADERSRVQRFCDIWREMNTQAGLDMVREDGVVMHVIPFLEEVVYSGGNDAQWARFRSMLQMMTNEKVRTWWASYKSAWIRNACRGK